jgi:hypothetical protein
MRKTTAEYTIKKGFRVVNARVNKYLTEIEQKFPLSTD